MTKAATTPSTESPQIGDIAPDFTTVTDSGSPLTLSDLRGKMIVLYFYPKDDTPGCTTEAQGFRDHYKAFEALGAQVIGVSKDSVKKHCNFKDKHSLPFPLVSDEDDTVCERYGVWGEKSMYGKKFMGITRATFLIDAEGVIREHWPKVKVSGHVEEVLEKTKALA